VRINFPVQPLDIFRPHQIVVLAAHNKDIIAAALL